MPQHTWPTIIQISQEGVLYYLLQTRTTKCPTASPQYKLNSMQPSATKTEHPKKRKEKKQHNALTVIRLLKKKGDALYF
jgi:hypothetical protein